MSGTFSIPARPFYGASGKMYDGGYSSFVLHNAECLRLFETTKTLVFALWRGVFI